MSTCRCGTDARGARLGCVECGVTLCPSCAIHLESTTYCPDCARTLLDTGDVRAAAGFELQ